MLSRKVMRPLLNTYHRHLLSSTVESARDLCQARLHRILAHRWHSQIPAYLLTHPHLLQSVVSNISENDFLQSTSPNVLYCAGFMCRWRASAAEADIVRAKDWLVPSRAEVWVVPLKGTWNIICCSTVVYWGYSGWKNYRLLLQSISSWLFSKLVTSERRQKIWAANVSESFSKCFSCCRSALYWLHWTEWCYIIYILSLQEIYLQIRMQPDLLWHLFLKPCWLWSSLGSTYVRVDAAKPSGWCIQRLCFGGNGFLCQQPQNCEPTFLHV